MEAKLEYWERTRTDTGRTCKPWNPSDDAKRFSYDISTVLSFHSLFVHFQSQQGLINFTPSMVVLSAGHETSPDRIKVKTCARALLLNVSRRHVTV